jgi:hypothetical protein
VVKLTGTLVAPAIEANNGLVPGVLAVISTCPANKGVSVVLTVLTVPTAVVDNCQLGSPTVEEISTPELLLARSW